MSISKIYSKFVRDDELLHVSGILRSAIAEGTGNGGGNYTGVVDIDTSKVVMTTGSQDITGNKTFLGPVSFYKEGQLVLNVQSGHLNDGLPGNIFFPQGNATAIDWTGRKLNNQSNLPVYDWQNNLIYDGDDVVANFSDKSLLDGGVESLNWNSRGLYDGNELLALNWSNRTLANAQAQTTLNWGSLRLQSGSQVRVDWNLGTLNYNFGPTLDWQNKLLYSSDDTSVDWENRQLSAVGLDFARPVLDWKSGILVDVTQSDGVIALDWTGRKLFDSDGNVALKWSERTLVDSLGRIVYDFENNKVFTAGDISIDYSGRKLHNSQGDVQLDWEQSTLNDTAGVAALNWDNREVVDETAVVSINWNTRTLRSGNSVTADWGTKQLLTEGVEALNWGQKYLHDGVGQSIHWHQHTLQAVDVTSGEYSPVLDWGNKLLVHSGNPVLKWGDSELVSYANGSGEKFLNWNNRTIYSRNGNVAATVVDGFRIYDSAESAQIALDGKLRNLVDSTANVSVNWSERWLGIHDSGWSWDVATLDWGQQKLYSYDAEAGVRRASLDWQSGILFDAAGNVAYDWEAGVLLSNGEAVIDLTQKRLYTEGELARIDWAAGSLLDGEIIVLDWSLGQLNYFFEDDNIVNQALAVDWMQQGLYYFNPEEYTWGSILTLNWREKNLLTFSPDIEDSIPTLNWETRTLFGDWAFESNALHLGEERGFGLKRNGAALLLGVISGSNAGVATRHGELIHSVNSFTSAGQAQTTNAILIAETTDASPTEMFLNGSASRFDIRSNSAVAFELIINAKRTDAIGEAAAIKFEGLIQRDGAEGTTSFVGIPIKTLYGKTNTAWNADISADVVNGALKVEVSGEVGKNIWWVGSVRGTEVCSD